MTNATDNADAFWMRYHGNVQVLTRLDWKAPGRPGVPVVGLVPVEYAQDESGAFFGRASIPGVGFAAFGPARTQRDLKKEIIRWGQDHGLRWHFRSPGSFLPDLLRAELSALSIKASRLAGEIGVGDHVVRQWLAGRSEPTEDELQRLCAALGVFPYELERR